MLSNLLTWALFLPFLFSATAFLNHVPSFQSTSTSSRNSRLFATILDPPLPNFCGNCGEKSMVLRVPPGDERTRACCDSCGRIEYSNPKVVVSCVVLTDDDRCLLAKRAIEPCLGTWGIPQGFMEHGETTREAAAREVLEETGAVVDDLKFRGVYNVPGSVQILFVARVSGAVVEKQIATSTLESSEVALYPIESIPYDDLSFPTVKWALDHCLKCAKDVDAGVAIDHPIQQRTKFYDSELDKWSEFEDEGPVTS